MKERRKFVWNYLDQLDDLILGRRYGEGTTTVAIAAVAEELRHLNEQIEDLINHLFKTERNTAR